MKDLKESAENTERIVFARLKYQIGQILAEKFLEYNDGKFHTAIELNPPTHAITDFVFEKLNEAKKAGYSEAMKEQRWIPVSERLPEKEIEVLVWSERYGRTFATFIDENKYGSIWIYHGERSVTFNAPTHWQLLPSPPSFTEQEQSTKEENA
jgi:hypothetical protein